MKYQLLMHLETSDPTDQSGATVASLSWLKEVVPVHEVWVHRGFGNISAKRSRNKRTDIAGGYHHAGVGFV